MDKQKFLLRIENCIAERLRPMVKGALPDCDVYIDRETKETYCLFHKGMFLYKYTLTKITELKDNKFKVYYYGMNFFDNEKPYFVKEVFSFKDEIDAVIQPYKYSIIFKPDDDIVKQSEKVDEYLAYTHAELGAIGLYLSKDNEVRDLKRDVQFYFLGKEHWNERLDYIKSWMYSFEFEIADKVLNNGEHLYFRAY